MDRTADVDMRWPVPDTFPALAAGVLHLWLVSLAQPQPAIDACARLLADDERERARRYYFDRDRHAFTIARGVLRRLLSGYTGIPAAEIRFTYSAHGKPALAAPPAGCDIAFNVSHSHQLALYGFCLGAQIGVDVEHMRENVECEALAGTVFSEAEQAALLALPPERRRQGFFNGWARKEAYIKAHGDGLSHPLKQFDVSLAPDVPAALIATRPDPSEAQRWSLGELPVPAGYAAAFVVRGQGWEAQLYRWG